MKSDADSDSKDFGGVLGPAKYCDLLIENWESFLSKHKTPIELHQESEFPYNELFQLGKETVYTLKLVKEFLLEQENFDDHGTFGNIDENTLQAIAKALEIITRAIAVYEAIAHVL